MGKILNLIRAKKIIKKYQKDDKTGSSQYFINLFDLLVLYQIYDYPKFSYYMKLYIEDFITFYFDMEEFFTKNGRTKKTSLHIWATLSLKEHENLPILSEEEYIREFKKYLHLIEKDFPEFIDAFCEGCINLDALQYNTKYFEETVYDKLSLVYLIPEKVIEYKLNLLFSIAWNILQERYPEIYKKDNRKNFKNN